MKGIILYILVDANWCNGGDIPNESEFILSTGTHTFRACLISQPLHYTKSHVFVRVIVSSEMSGYWCG